MKRLLVDNVNGLILRKCREQMGFSIDEIIKKVGSEKIAEFENNKAKPSFKQLEKLSNLYLVPEWVFLEKQLPKEYALQTIPSFRILNKGVKLNSKQKTLIKKVEQFRNLTIELKADMDEPVVDFSPRFNLTQNIDNLAKSIRKWLDMGDKFLEFKELRRKVESKGIFVFMTDSFQGWSKFSKKDFRGLSIYHKKLPIIVINSSDAYNARSFTLLHELGHLLRKDTVFDKSFTSQKKEEKWCDDLAGNILMPSYHMDKLSHLSNMDEDTLYSNIEIESKKLKVSRFAFIVRARKRNLIIQRQYDDIHNRLKKEYKDIEEQNKQTRQGMYRNIPNEKINQYGIYFNTVLQSYQNKETTLLKACQMLDIKNPQYFIKVNNV